MTEDWVVRQGQANKRIDDRAWIRSSLRAGLEKNSYFYGVEASHVADLAERAANASNLDWHCDVVCTGDDDREPAGWVIYRQVPTMTIAYAHVDEAFRGLGAWRCLREHLGLKDGQLVGVVLASPQAMGLARKRYQAKHNYGLLLEWL